MTQNLYAMLGISETAPMLEVRAAYKRKLGALVHRKSSAGRSKSAMAELYREERALREAMTILTDPARRNLYNHFRDASDSAIPGTEEALWDKVEQVVVDNTTLSALRLLASLTTLPLQEAPLLKAPAPKRKPEEEKTEPLGARPSSMKNRSQRADVRSTIEQVVPNQRTQRTDMDATELIRRKPQRQSQGQKGTASTKAPLTKKAPLDTLKERMSQSKKSKYTEDTTLRVHPDEASAANSSTSKSSNPKSTQSNKAQSKTATSNSTNSTSKVSKPKAPVTVADLVRQHGYTGRLFRAIRENQGLTTSQLSQQTNVPVGFINAIENEDFSVFSTPVFVRGVVKNISRSLGIQDRNVVTGFLNRMGF